MADIIDRRPGGGGAGGSNVRYHDEGDGSYSESEAAHLRGWDTDSLSWIKVLVDSTGRLVATPGKTIQFASIAASSSGDNTIVSADTTRKIKVVSYVFVAAAAVTARWKSGAGTNLSGAMSLAANGGVVAPDATGTPYLQTAVNEALVLNLGGAISVAGHLAYYLET